MTGAFRAASLVPSLGATGAVRTFTLAGAPPSARRWSSATIAATVAGRSSLRPAELATTPTIRPDRDRRYSADLAGFFTALAACVKLAGMADSSSTGTTVPPAAGAKRIHDRTSAALIAHERFFVASRIVRAMRTAWVRAGEDGAVLDPRSDRRRVDRDHDLGAAAGSRRAVIAAATTGSASASRPLRARPITMPLFVIAIVALTG